MPFPSQYKILQTLSRKKFIYFSPERHGSSFMSEQDLPELEKIMKANGMEGIYGGKGILAARFSEFQDFQKKINTLFEVERCLANIRKIQKQTGNNFPLKAVKPNIDRIKALSDQWLPERNSQNTFFDSRLEDKYQAFRQEKKLKEQLVSALIPSPLAIALLAIDIALLTAAAVSCYILFQSGMPLVLTPAFMVVASERVSSFMAMQYKAINSLFHHLMTSMEKIDPQWAYQQTKALEEFYNIDCLIGQTLFETMKLLDEVMPSLQSEEQQLSATNSELSTRLAQPRSKSAASSYTTSLFAASETLILETRNSEEKSSASVTPCAAILPTSEDSPCSDELPAARTEPDPSLQSKQEELLSFEEDNAPMGCWI